MLELIAGLKFTALSDADLNALLLRASMLADRHRGDHAEHVAALRARAARRHAIADWLPRRMGRWWSDIDLSAQVWAGKTAEAPSASLFKPDYSQMHAEAPKPKWAFWTSTFMEPFTSPWLEWSESQQEGPLTLWHVGFGNGARVAEIHSRDDWATLCRRYPNDSRGSVHTHFDASVTDLRLDPGWSKVAEDWDGVHLSVGGWLTAEDVPVSHDGETTELRAWNMESTLWLRWMVESAELLSLTGTA